LHEWPGAGAFVLVEKDIGDVEVTGDDVEGREIIDVVRYVEVFHLVFIAAPLLQLWWENDIIQLKFQIQDQFLHCCILLYP
jgi:hypothetical protein